MPEGENGGSDPDELLEALESGDPSRRAAAIAGIRLDPELELQIVTTLAEVCRSDPSPVVRAAAVTALERYLRRGSRESLS
jgi:hypothetical protein